MVEEIPRGHMRMLHGGNAECICKDAGEDAERVHETPREISSERIHEDAGGQERVYVKMHMLEGECDDRGVHCGYGGNNGDRGQAGFEDEECGGQGRGGHGGRGAKATEDIRLRTTLFKPY